MEHPRPGPILNLLGGAVILEGATPVSGPATQRHRVALLALLALHARPMSRDKLIAYLWPERDSASARNLLKSAVHELRKAFGEDALQSLGDQLALDPARIGCDVNAFERAVATGQLSAARALYRGPFLDGFFLKESGEFEEWAALERARLHALHAAMPAPTAEVAPTPRPPMPVPPPAARPGRAARTVPAVLALAVLLLVAGYARHRVSNGAAPRKYIPVLIPDDSAGSALQFSDTGVNAATPLGAPVTTQVDNIRVDLMVRLDPGPRTRQEVLYYNGHGAYTGWGLLVIGRSEGQPDGTVALLAGGIIITATPLVLAPGRWQHLSAERREGTVIVTLEDRAFVVGPFPVNPMGGEHLAEERTSVGGAGDGQRPGNGFRGAIDRVRIRDLAGAYWIERWNFDEGQGTITVGTRGSPLTIGSARWIRGTVLPPPSVFWGRLETICSQAFAGSVSEGRAEEGLPTGTPLILHVLDCAPNEIRIAVQAGADRSRTWILDRTSTAIGMRQVVHRQDGRLEASGGFAGATGEEGTPALQRFAGGDRHWSLEVVPGQLATFTMRRTGQEGTMTMTFQLDRQLVLPPPPWGTEIGAAPH